MKIKRTLVCDGGGMKGAFGVGVMVGLRDMGIDYSFFDNYVGTSAGACSIAYFLTGQIDEGLHIWSGGLMNDFIKWNGFKPHVDLNYLRRILTEIEPLNLELLKHRQQKAYVALANVGTKKTDYLLLNQKLDPIDILMASVAMPTYCPPKELDGQFYYDGGLTSQPPLDFVDSLEQDEIWVILNRPLGYRVTSLGWKLMSFFVKDKIAKQFVAEKPERINKILEKLEKRTDLIIICPKQKLPVHWLTTTKEDILKTIELGKGAIKEILENRNNLR